MKGKNGIVDFSRARVSRKKVSPGRYGGNIAFFFGLIQGRIHVCNPKDLWRTSTFSAPQRRTDDPYESVGARWRGKFDPLGAILIIICAKELLLYRRILHRDFVFSPKILKIS